MNDKMRSEYLKHYDPHNDATWFPFQDGWQAALATVEPSLSSQYDGDRTYHCKPVQVITPVGFISLLHGLGIGSGCNLMYKKEGDYTTPLYISPPDYEATAKAYAQSVDEVIKLWAENKALKQCVAKLEDKLYWSEVTLALRTKTVEYFIKKYKELK